MGCHICGSEGMFHNCVDYMRVRLAATEERARRAEAELAECRMVYNVNQADCVQLRSELATLRAENEKLREFGSMNTAEMIEYQAQGDAKVAALRAENEKLRAATESALDVKGEGKSAAEVLADAGKHNALEGRAINLRGVNGEDEQRKLNEDEVLEEVRRRRAGEKNP